MKKLMIKNGSYTTKDGEVKNRYQNIGVIMSGDKGEFMLLDPTVNLAGFDRQGKDRVMVSIFEDEPRQAQSNTQTIEEDSIPF